jgi:hypothetical protein
VVFLHGWVGGLLVGPWWWPLEASGSAQRGEQDVVKGWQIWTQRSEEKKLGTLDGNENFTCTSFPPTDLETLATLDFSSGCKVELDGV